jgi:hypothetical protein
MSSNRVAPCGTGAGDRNDTDAAPYSLLRIVLMVVFGGLIVAIFGAMAREHVRIVPVRRRRGPVLSVEEAIRLRPH